MLVTPGAIEASGGSSSGQAGRLPATLIVYLMGPTIVHRLRGRAAEMFRLDRPLVTPRLLFAFLALCGSTASFPLPALAVPMVNDPKGFEGIPWGAAFSETSEFLLVENGPHIKGYELKQGPPDLGPATVDSMRFLTFDGRFARVVIRYHGQQTHERIVSYFQSRYGPLDRTPGQISKGPVQQFNWQGEDSEIILTYEGMKDRGIIFFEHRPSALKFSEGQMAPDPDLGGATY